MPKPELWTQSYGMMNIGTWNWKNRGLSRIRPPDLGFEVNGDAGGFAGDVAARRRRRMAREVGDGRIWSGPTGSAARAAAARAPARRGVAARRGEERHGEVSRGKVRGGEARCHEAR